MYYVMKMAKRNTNIIRRRCPKCNDPDYVDILTGMCCLGCGYETNNLGEEIKKSKKKK